MLLNKKCPTNNPYERLISYVSDRLGHDWRYAIDGSKITRELDWSPTVQFEEGIEKTIDWYLEDQSYLA